MTRSSQRRGSHRRAGTPGVWCHTIDDGEQYMSLDAVRDGDVRIDVALLGDVATRRTVGSATADELVAVPGIRARSLLAALARTPGRVRSAAALVDEVWGDRPPKSPGNALHTQISRLRAVLPRDVLESVGSGYRLRLPRAAVDLAVAEDAADEWDRTASVPLGRLRSALALWRGEPGTDLTPGAAADELTETAARVHERLEAAEIDALLAAGETAEAVSRAVVRVERRPWDEQAVGHAMLALARSGRSTDGLALFAQYRRSVADRMGADPSPVLVDLNAQILRGDVDGPAAPVRPASAGPQPEQSVLAPAPRGSAVGLRAAPNALLGRDDDLAALDTLLAAARVVTVLGPGGTGKTRLVNELGRRVAEKESVALVELASLRSGEDVLAAVSATLGLSEVDLAPGRTIGRLHSARDRLRSELRGRSLLLILDNCEHVGDSVADLVADLVSAAEQLTVLTTSRSPLHLGAEVVYPLAPLGYADADAPAVLLFESRARAVRPSASLDPAVVQRICRTLDGLPLALELAAARVRTMSLEEIADRLADRFALLRSHDRTSPERHRTLHAVIDWSWQLLGEHEQIVLRRLCRFPAGFTAEAARAVADWGDLAGAFGDPVDSALEGLVNQSLLTVVDADAPDGSPTIRYLMLETVREYGEMRLADAEAGESDEVYRRQAAWARAFADRAIASAWDDELQGLRSVDADHDNLLAVLRQAVASEDAVTTASTFAVLAALWSVRGAHSEVITWTSRVLEVLENGDLAPGSDDSIVTVWLLLGPHVVFAEVPRGQARVRLALRRRVRAHPPRRAILRFLVDLVLAIGKPVRVGRTVAEGVRSDDPVTRMAALATRAHLRENLGDVEGALRDGWLGVEASREAGGIWSRAVAFQFVGSMLGQTGNPGDAAEYYAEAAVALDALGAVDEARQLHSYRASSLISAGRVDDARALLRAVVDDPGPADPRDLEQSRAALVATLAEADLADGDVERGLAGYREALAVVESQVFEDTYGDPFGLLVAASAIAAFVLAGRAGEVRELTARTVRATVGRKDRPDFVDRPLTGAVVVAVGGALVASGREDAGLELLALGVTGGGRQDFGMLRHDAQIAAAAEVVGESRWREAYSRARGLSRVARWDRTLAALGEVACTL
ncbi:BTAD domain-containing putative transcriptional regulator [Rhodococcus sp. HNM0569]|uniref:BTAD domain-containing putative transcriptional regulator n=1 Tax=Rhodococcus sp. HNM0569 TaxID=2716340 RepID=UPI00146D1FBA|nr:BTAD domain-containing putative transcriptional regulator [Rhodococcus sp. HNM0569]NLU84144.1 AAA family ATPase [Rhodococcus sp. HNM0569]